MDNRCVKDLMLPLREYAVVSQEATVLEALRALDQAQANLSEGRQKHRAVLIVDEQQNVVGKLGHLGFLKALEPKYDKLGDLQMLSRSGMSEEFLSSMMKSLSMWQDSLSDICRRARSKKVKDVMRPVTENIDEDASLSEAIHKFLMYETLSLLVIRGTKVVGIIRLSDLFDEVARNIKGQPEPADRNRRQDED